MKKLTQKTTIIFTLILSLCLPACQENDEAPALNEDQVIAALIENIEKNSILLDSAAHLTTTLVSDQAVIKNALKESKSKGEFIAAMNSLITDVFDQSIMKCRNTLGLSRQSYSAQRKTERFFSFASLEDTKVNPLNAYAAQIKEEAKEGGQEKWLFTSYSMAPSQAHDLPMEQLSLNYSKVTRVLEIFDIIMNNESTTQLDAAIDQFQKSNKDLVVMIALLVPAIQFARESRPAAAKLYLTCASGKHFEQKFIDDLNVLMQQQRAAGFLGGLELLVTEEYDNGNEETASVNILRGIYRNTMTQLWTQMWEYAKG